MIPSAHYRLSPRVSSAVSAAAMAFLKKLFTGADDEKDKLDFGKLNLQTLQPLEVAAMIEVTRGRCLSSCSVLHECCPGNRVYTPLFLFAGRGRGTQDAVQQLRADHD